MAGQWGGTIGTVVPAPGDSRKTVMDWRLQIFFFGQTGHTGAVSCWGALSGPCAGSFSGSSSAAGSVAPSTSALAGVVCLEDDDELHVYRRDLRREPRDISRELCDGGAVTRCVRCQVFDHVDRLFLEVPR